MVIRGPAVAGAEDVDSSAVVVETIGAGRNDIAVNRHSVAETAATCAIGGRQNTHLAVRGAAVAGAVDVDRARVVVLPVGSDHDCAAVERHRAAKVVERRGVGGRQKVHFGVRVSLVTRAEDVDRARVVVLLVGPDHDGVAVDGHGVAKATVHRGVGGRQNVRFGVRVSSVGRSEDVDRACVIISLVCPDHDGVAGDCHRPPELVLGRGVGGSQLGDLGVRVFALAEYVDRARVVVLLVGTDHDDRAVDGHGVPEVVVPRGVGGRQLLALDVRGTAVVRAEDVGRARVGGGTVVVVGPNNDRVAVDGH